MTERATQTTFAAHFAGPGQSTWGITPAQTVGPFFHYGLTPRGRYPVSDVVTSEIATDDAVGQRIRIEGRVLDGEGNGVPDAMLEIWQADGEGRIPGISPVLANARFRGFGRAPTDATGGFSFSTIKPGRVPGANGSMQAPHLSVGVFGRGLLKRLHTRVYFEDEQHANASDPILAQVPPERRATLISRRDPGAPVPVYAIAIVLRGENETVFFEV